VNLSEVFIRRPVMTVALTVSAIVFGIVAYFRLPVSDLPAIDYPVIQVQVNYPGATPETMANNVATRRTTARAIRASCCNSLCQRVSTELPQTCRRPSRAPRASCL